MIRIAVCDDDTTFLDTFARLLSSAFAGAGQQASILAFPDGKSLIEKAEKEKQIFDAVFLDVEMPGLNGFQTAQRLRELNTVFILLFTTYIEHQSREGYRYGAFRYIFKNNLKAEINEAVPSIIKKLSLAADGREEITLKHRNLGVIESLTLKTQDIVYLKEEKTRRVTLRTVYSEYELLTKPLSEYAELLRPFAFVQIMRSYLLNFNHVEGIGTDAFVLTGGLTVPLGVKRQARKSSIEQYLKFLEGRM